MVKIDGGRLYLKNARAASDDDGDEQQGERAWALSLKVLFYGGKGFLNTI